MTLECMRPDPCMSKYSCHNIKTKYCCWHEDIRTHTEKNTIYLDRYGEIDLTAFDMLVPQDIHYCPSCRITTESAADIINKIMETLPQKIKEQQIAEREAEIAKLELRFLKLAKQKDFSESVNKMWKEVKREISDKKRKLIKFCEKDT